MTRSRSLLFAAIVAAMALPLTASQFIELPFDQIARGSGIIVRGTVGPVTSSWDSDGQIIYSYATLSVTKYFGGHGPSVLSLREVGGTVGDYTMDAIGFPELREGEEVVLFLNQWDDSSDWRIEAYNQGKYLVRENAKGRLMVVRDSFTQGSGRLDDPDHGFNAVRPDEGIGLDELEEMISDARRAADRPVRVLDAN